MTCFGHGSTTTLTSECHTGSRVVHHRNPLDSLFSAGAGAASTPNDKSVTTSKVIVLCVNIARRLRREKNTRGAKVFQNYAWQLTFGPLNTLTVMAAEPPYPECLRSSVPVPHTCQRRVHYYRAYSPCPFPLAGAGLLTAVREVERPHGGVCTSIDRR